MRSDKSKDIVAGDRDYETCVLETKEADEITVDKKSEKDKKENMSKKTVQPFLLTKLQTRAPTG